MNSYLLSARMVDITPERPCMLAGFGQRRTSFRIVMDPLRLMSQCCIGRIGACFSFRLICSIPSHSSLMT